MTPVEFFDALRTYCGATNASITSYGRTPNHNRKVGGVPTSKHQTWLAADVVYDTPILLPTRTALAGHLGLRLLDESDHDHLQAP
jgi:hypothetical protein